MKDWIRMFLRLRLKIPQHPPSSPQEACVPVPTSPSVTTRPSKQPFHIAHSQVPSFPSRRFVPSPTRLHCTGTQSLIYLTLTHEPSASSGKHTVSTWLLTDFQTLRVGWQDLTPPRLRVHARKWLSSRAQLQHRLVSSTRNQIQVFPCIFFLAPSNLEGNSQFRHSDLIMWRVRNHTPPPEVPFLENNLATGSMS